MTKLLIIGDVHGNLDQLVDLLNQSSFDFALQVGDFGTYLPTSNLSSIPAHRRNNLGQFAEYYENKKPIPGPMYFCKGNHEDFDLLNSHLDQPEILPNLFYIPNGEVREIQGIRIGFLGGNFSPKWFDRPISQSCQSQKSMGYLRKYEVQRLEEHPTPIDILVTHEPSFIPQFTGDREYGCEVIQSLIESIQPRFAFSGHIHKYAEGKLGQTQCVALGAVGYSDKSTYSLTIR